MTSPRIPKPDTASYRAAAHLYTVGPLTPAELFEAIACGDKPSSRLLMLESATRTNWLIEVAGKIAISETARAHFASLDAEEKPTPKWQGVAATPRPQPVSVYDRPALSRKYMPSTKGNRDDVPAFSVREKVSFRSVPTGGA
jgi:hypothetical protein